MTTWLRCRLNAGMFSDEVAVTYPAKAESWQKSVFVPSSFVRTEGKFQENVEGAVRVDVVERDGARFAVLPTSRRDIVRVEISDLLPQ